MPQDSTVSTLATGTQPNDSQKSRAAVMLDMLHPDLSRGSALGDDQLLDDLACLTDLIGVAAHKSGEIADDTVPNAAFMAYRIVQAMRADRNRQEGGNNE